MHRVFAVYQIINTKEIDLLDIDHSDYLLFRIELFQTNIF